MSPVQRKVPAETQKGVSSSLARAVDPAAGALHPMSSPSNHQEAIVVGRHSTSWPAHQPRTSPCWTEVPTKDGTGECRSSCISSPIPNVTRAGQAGWEGRLGTLRTEAGLPADSWAQASPHPSRWQLLRRGFMASGLGCPGFLDRAGPSSTSRQAACPLIPRASGWAVPYTEAGGIGLPSQILQGSLLPEAAQVLV